MPCRLICLALGLASAAVLSAAPRPAAGQVKFDPNKVEYPRLRAALHELREARGWIQESRVNYPPGVKEAAVAHIQATIDGLRDVLAVRDVNSFVGYDRNKDYYNRFADNPELRSALQDVRDARDELRAAKGDLRGQKDALLDNLDIAAGDIVVLIRHNLPKKK
jgi:hypothetical protein